MNIILLINTPCIKQVLGIISIGGNITKDRNSPVNLMLSGKGFILGVIAMLVLFAGCERPNSPDFNLSNTIEFPFLNEKEFEFLGGANALIDTTGEHFEELFHLDDESFVTLAKQQEFDFGELEDVLPEVEIDPIIFNAETGEIDITNFSSQDENGNLGSVSFEDLTGTGVIAPEEGDFIPGGQSPGVINIELDTDYFESATIKGGSILITLDNQLGMDLDQLDITLNSGSFVVGGTVFNQLNHGERDTGTISVAENTELSDMNIDVTASWSDQVMQDDAGELIIRNAGGVNLYASELSAAISSQEFDTTGTVDVPSDEFVFDSTDHYVELSGGEISVRNIVNNLDLDIDYLALSFPGIFLEPYGQGDTLLIEFSGDNKILRNSTLIEGENAQLEGARLFADGNAIRYNILAITEDTQLGGGSEIRTIAETDNVEAEIHISDLNIRSVSGVVKTREIFLNQRDLLTDNESVDLMNDTEAEIIEIEGLSELSERLEGIEFMSARLSIQLQTNIGIPTTVVGAFMGVTKNDDHFFLAGKPGEDTFVTEEDAIDGLLYNNVQLENDRLIRFDAISSANQVQSITFNNENSTITDFLNRLPQEIRFIGKAVINQEESSGTVSSPVRLDSEIVFEIPMNIRTLSEASFADTVDRDLSGLPHEDDETFIEEGTVTVKYLNRIPIEVGVNLEFLDEEDRTVTTLPLTADPELRMMASDVDESGFSNEGEDGLTVIRLNREQVRQLYKTRKLKYNAWLLTRDQEEVKLRANDFVRFSVSAKFNIETTVN